MTTYLQVCTDPMTTYGDWLRRRGHSESTVESRVRFHASRAFGEWPAWEGVGVDEVVDYLGRYSGWTRITYHTMLVSVFDFMVDTGRATSNPARMVRRSRKPRPRPRPLSDDELRAALGAADARTTAFLLLGYLAGLRAHEIAKMHGGDIDEDRLRVLGKGGVDATLPTHPMLWQLAATYPRDGFWFPSPYGAHIGAATVTGSVRTLFRSLGIPGASHRARHTYGTRLLRGGANLRVVQELMRHQSLATTALYLGVDEDERRTAIRSIAA